MIIIDSRGTIIRSNSAFSKILGYEREEVVGRLLGTLIHERDASRFSGLLSRLFTGETEHLLQDCRFIGHKGLQHWLHVSMTTIGDPSSTKPDAFGIVEDITKVKRIHADLRRSKESAEEATKVKSEFLANMSHEIRTPIHTIIGMEELLEDTSLDDEQKEYANQIGFAADVLLSLVNNILDFSKIEAGKLNLEIIDFEVCRMAEEAVDLVALEAHRKGLEIVTWISPSLPRRFLGDPHRIRQIIVNLIKNAVKFTEKGQILLTTKAIGTADGATAVRFAVRDTGIGIPNDKKDRLFQSFTQVDSSTTRRFGGTGLGLTISRNLTRMMGGKIGLQSTPGRGSSFWFVLPMKSAEADGSTTGGSAPELKGIRLLIVDDNRTVLRTLDSYLSYWGCRVEYAEDGKTALRKLRSAAETESVFDVVLVDAQLPGIDGWQLASEISSDKSINYVKLILLTPAGKSGDEAKMKLLHWFDDYLSKPVSVDQLREALSKIMSQAIDLESVEVEELPAESPAPVDVGNSIRILLAEDHVVNQQLFRTILEKMGYTIQVASDGEEAVALAADNRFDLIFMDVQMPRMNGLKATETLRGMNIQIPIIAVTASATKEEMQKCLRAGMNDFISKPFKKKDLAPVLEKWTATAPDSEESEMADRAPEDVIFDFQAAVETFLGDEAAVHNVLGAFSEKLRNDMKLLEKARADGDMGGLSTTAHSIKGGALNLEAHRLGRAAADLEQRAKEDDREAAEASHHRLAEACEEFLRHLEVNHPS